ncbi:hypothetical protein EQG68_06625 [Flavobacterium piscinae]|uniref:Lipoprotein n=1 Tax=Flavobacterium piscinae TaxID=2506424 RepID=A0A4Q1KVE3_9FLAO|nr:DUF6252 family protein [Flavobacterium piscinae]RXR33154.1 hypothetical protein EQG68_06625 [Flavobacterium piscinae]
MKTIKFICACFLVTSALFLTSCSDDDGGGGGNAAAGTITAKVDGTTVTTLEITTSATLVSAGGNTTLSMLGTSTSQKGFSFTINGFDGVGTYEFGGSSSVFRVASYIEANVSNPLDSQTWSAPYDDDSPRGTISFSEVTDTRVKGTFTYSAKNPNDNSVKQITEGSFNVEIN